MSAIQDGRSHVFPGIFYGQGSGTFLDVVNIESTFCSIILSSTIARASSVEMFFDGIDDPTDEWIGLPEVDATRSPPALVEGVSVVSGFLRLGREVAFSYLIVDVYVATVLSF